MAVQFYPVDVDGLRKGDLIPMEEVERVTGLLQSHPRFRLAAMRMRDQVAKTMRERGKPARVRLTRAGLEILKDNVASTYSVARRNKKLRGAFTEHQWCQEVDVSGLTREEASQHEREVIKGGMILQAIAATRLKVNSVLRDTERKTPGRIAGA